MNSAKSVYLLSKFSVSDPSDSHELYLLLWSPFNMSSLICIAQMFTKTLVPFKLYFLLKQPSSEQNLDHLAEICKFLDSTGKMVTWQVYLKFGHIELRDYIIFPETILPIYCP